MLQIWLNYYFLLARGKISKGSILYLVLSLNIPITNAHLLTFAVCDAWFTHFQLFSWSCDGYWAKRFRKSFEETFVLSLELYLNGLFVNYPLIEAEIFKRIIVKYKLSLTWKVAFCLGTYYSPIVFEFIYIVYLHSIQHYSVNYITFCQFMQLRPSEIDDLLRKLFKTSLQSHTSANHVLFH